MIKKITLIICILYSGNIWAYFPITTDARIKTLIYSPTEVFKLKFHYNYQSYIEFPKHEKIEIISLGDHYAWDIKQVGTRLFIKPQQSGMLTNMTIITNKRPYHFEIESSTKALDITDAELVYVARFYYPETSYDFMQTVRIKKPLEEYDIRPVNDEQDKKPIVPVIPPVTGDKNTQSVVPKTAGKRIKLPNMKNNNTDIYNYAYSMVGPEAPIAPIKIYDDGINTYFEFATNILPDIYYINKNGSEIPAKYSVDNKIVTVNNTAWQFSLRDNKNIICVFNEAKLSY